jgi:hypothetical protein
MKQASFKRPIAFVVPGFPAAGSARGHNRYRYPGYTNLGVNSTLQYATVAKGLTNTTVKWEINRR